MGGYIVGSVTMDMVFGGRGLRPSAGHRVVDEGPRKRGPPLYYVYLDYLLLIFCLFHNSVITRPIE